MALPTSRGKWDSECDNLNKISNGSVSNQKWEEEFKKWDMESGNSEVRNRNSQMRSLNLEVRDGNNKELYPIPHMTSEQWEGGLDKNSHF